MLFQFLSLGSVVGIVKDPGNITNETPGLRQIYKRISDKWTDLDLSLEPLMILSKEIIEAASTVLLDSDIFTKHAFSYLWKACFKIGILYPISILRQLRREAERFYDDVATELQWSHERKKNRMFEVNTEITATGTYTHTTEELELGARLAWRNSAKCIGR